MYHSLRTLSEMRPLVSSNNAVTQVFTFFKPRVALWIHGCSIFSTRLCLLASSAVTVSCGVVRAMQYLCNVLITL